jgi:hypothetical protein
VFGGTDRPEAAAQPTRSVHTVLAAVPNRLRITNDVQQQYIPGQNEVPHRFHNSIFIQKNNKS